MGSMRFVQPRHRTVREQRDCSPSHTTTLLVDWCATSHIMPFRHGANSMNMLSTAIMQRPVSVSVYYMSVHARCNRTSGFALHFYIPSVYITRNTNIHSTVLELFKFRITIIWICACNHRISIVQSLQVFNGGSVMNFTDTHHTIRGL